VRGVTFLSMSTSDETMPSLRRVGRAGSVSPLSSRPDRGLTPPAHLESLIRDRGLTPPAHREPLIRDRGLTPPAHPEPPIANRGLTPPAHRVFCSTPVDSMDGLERDRSHLVLDLDDVWDLVAR
jgi:hypothetical protein